MSSRDDRVNHFLSALTEDEREELEEVIGDD